MILIWEIPALGQRKALLKQRQVSTASHVLLWTAKTFERKSLSFINYTQPSRFAMKKLCQCLLVTKLTIKDLHNILELLFELARNCRHRRPVRSREIVILSSAMNGTVKIIQPLRGKKRRDKRFGFHFCFSSFRPLLNGTRKNLSRVSKT